MSSTPIFSRSNRIALFCTVLAVCPACFREADISKIVCNDTKYCPGGYVCVVPPGTTRGSCERPWDSGGSGSVASDSAAGMDGPRALDSVALDFGATGVDQALANGDSSASPLDVSIGGDIVPADLPAEISQPLSDSSIADALPDAPPDIPLVVDVASDLPGRDAPLKAGGATCTSGTECTSTYCVDGVCCDGPCTGQCQACAEANKVGTCTTVSGSPRGTRTACTATQMACAGQCGGSLPNQCSYPGSESVCAGASCSTDLAMKTASVCNGAGTCAASSVVPCPSGKYCTGGACVTQIANGGSCQNSNQCTNGNCSNSICCSSAQTGCGSSCVSLSSNNANCGSCGRSCATGSSCSGGTCYLVDGQSCTTGGQCLSGVCSTFYVDGDGDGYGVGVGISQCGTTPPSGYANKAGDCCDSDGSAHPGQTSFFTTADACGDFDYNCDTQETQKSNGPAQGTCGGPPTCDPVTCTYTGGCSCGGSAPCSTYNPGPCGGSFIINAVGCTFYMGSCTVLSNGGPAGTQACN